MCTCQNTNGTGCSDTLTKQKMKPHRRDELHLNKNQNNLLALRIKVVTGKSESWRLEKPRDLEKHVVWDDRPSRAEAITVYPQAHGKTDWQLSNHKQQSHLRMLPTPKGAKCKILKQMFPCFCTRTKNIE